MLIRCKSAIVAAVLSAAPAAFVATHASPANAAGKYYSSCDALHQDYKYGVAEDENSANKQVRDGYGRPATGKKAKAVYHTNHSRLDRDHDGTACEA